ncbi:MAG TPA: SOS response-associated peptidase [Steroidobacteraceae bacterium]
MCGRYITAEAAKFEKLVRLGKISWDFAPSFNVAPTQQVPVIRSAEGVSEALTLRWGLIPFFARGAAPKYSTINATIENLENGACWRGPWGRGQRCLMPAAGFYEWHLNESGQKEPFFIHLVDQEIFAFAGLWDRSYKADGTAIESCALLTMPGNDLLRQVHNTGANPFRMPAILTQVACEVWLNGSGTEAKATLRQYPQEMMVAYQVGRRVNSPKNDDRQLLSPVQGNVGDQS